MAITFNGNGTVTGITTLPDGIITNDDLAGSIAEGKLAGSIPISKLATTGTASSSTFLSGTGAFTAAGGGKLLQTIQVESNGYFTTNSATPVAITGLTVNITPSATTSKILIMVDMTVGQSAAGQNGGIIMFRDSTQIHLGDTAGSRTRFSSATCVHAAYAQAGVSMTYVDSPNTLSEVTYLLKAQSTSTSYTMSVGGPSYTEDAAYRARVPSCIIVQEIGA